MKADISTVESLLHGSSVFLIPHFQRSYSWGEKQWARLWADLHNVASGDTQRQHFIGPLVCAALPFVAGENVVRFEVIDGQQRLTTLSTLFGAMRDVAHKFGHHDLADQINEDFLLHHRRKDHFRYKLVPRTTDRGVWQRLIDRDADTHCDQSKIDDAWRWFQEQLEPLVQRDGVDVLNRLLHAASQRLAFVAITIKDENPYRVFESLNTTGLALTEFDLVRNHLFMKVPVAEQELFDQKVWRNFERSWIDCAAKDGSVGTSATVFLRHFLMRKVGYFARGEVFVQFKAWADGLGNSPAEIVAMMKKSADIDADFRRVERIRDQRNRGDAGADWPKNAIDKRLLQLAFCDARSAMPLILELFDREQEGKLEKGELVHCMHDIVGFLLRRAFAGEQSKIYAKKFVEIARRLEAPVRACLQTELHRIGWPSDNIVVNELRSFALYRSEPMKARLILEELERAEAHPEASQLAALQIEHVLPQKLSGADGQEWKAMLGENWRDDHAARVHTLGNLTLTGFNQTLSNKAFATKCATLRKSKIGLNDPIVARRKWNASVIEARGDELAATFCSLFPVVGSAPIDDGIDQVQRTERADINRAFWKQVATALGALESADFSGTPCGQTSMIAATNFRSLRIVLRFDRATDQIGVRASFCGADGLRQFATLRTQRARIETRLGASVGEQEARRGRTPGFSIERSNAGLSTAQGEASAIMWLANQAHAFRVAVEPSLEDIGAKRKRQRTAEVGRIQMTWFEQLLAAARLRTPLHANQSPQSDSYVSATSGVRGLAYQYVVRRQTGRVELYFQVSKKDPTRPKRQFAWFESHRREIAKALPALKWIAIEGRNGCQLSIPLARGYEAPIEQWSEIHEQLIDTMIELHATLQPYIDLGEVERV